MTTRQVTVRNIDHIDASGKYSDDKIAVDIGSKFSDLIVAYNEKNPDENINHVVGSENNDTIPNDVGVIEVFEKLYKVKIHDYFKRSPTVEIEVIKTPNFWNIYDQYLQKTDRKIELLHHKTKDDGTSSTYEAVLLEVDKRIYIDEYLPTTPNPVIEIYATIHVPEGKYDFAEKRPNDILFALCLFINPTIIFILILVNLILSFKPQKKKLRTGIVLELITIFLISFQLFWMVYISMIQENDNMIYSAFHWIAIILFLCFSVIISIFYKTKTIHLKSLNIARFSYFILWKIILFFVCPDKFVYNFKKNN